MRTTTILRNSLRRPDILVAPGAYDCLTAKLIERAGFPAVYMTGGGTAVTRVGKPDLGFTTLTEMLASASAILCSAALRTAARRRPARGGIGRRYAAHHRPNCTHGIAHGARWAVRSASARRGSNSPA